MHLYEKESNRQKANNPQSVHTQTEKMVNHTLKHNQSYRGLEGMARIMNMMENASIRVPETKYRILKMMDSELKTEFQIECGSCGNFTSSFETKVHCTACTKFLTTSNSKYFVYIPLEQQLRRTIHEHWDEIMKNRISRDDTINDIHDAVQFRRIAAELDGFNLLSLLAGTDGANIFHNNSQSFWAIQIYQNFLDPRMRYVPKNIMVVAFFCDSRKPNMKDFFRPLLRDLKAIHSNGGLIVEKNGTKHKFMPVITHFVSDLPAKIDVQEMKSYAGFNSCGYCLHPGESVKQTAKKNPKCANKESSYVRYIRRKCPDKLRTHNEMLQIYSGLNNANAVCGIKGVSCMIAAPHFDLISGFGIDYMHAVLLGVTKKILNFWLDSSNHKEAFYIKPSDQKLLSERITNIKPIREISRKPGPITKRADYKANEYRTLLLYYLRFCLSGLLNKKYVDHFQLLSSSIYVLLKDKITMNEILDCEIKLTKFADEYEILYGQCNVTMNVHLLRHIAFAVRQLGPLWAQSTFALEANNALLTNTTSRRSVLHSISWKYKSRLSLSSIDIERSASMKVHGKEKITLSKSEMDTLNSNNFKTETSNLFIIYQRISVQNKIFTSKKCKDLSTIDYFVKLHGGEMGSVMFYFVSNNTLFALFELYDVTDTLDHLYVVRQSSVKKIIKLQEIDKKMIYMKIRGREILVLRPNMYEKT